REELPQLAAWLALVPRQNSSGGRMCCWAWCGDLYLRAVLIHGARLATDGAQRKKDQICGWPGAMLTRRNKNIVVALAKKNARMDWALLAHDREFQSGHTASLVPSFSPG